MKIFIDGATDAQSSEYAQAIIDGEKAKGILIALVKVVRLAKGILLFFDRQEWEEWAKDKTASQGFYQDEKAE